MSMTMWSLNKKYAAENHDMPVTWLSLISHMGVSRCRQERTCPYIPDRRGLSNDLAIAEARRNKNPEKYFRKYLTVLSRERILMTVRYIILFSTVWW